MYGERGRPARIERKTRKAFKAVQELRACGALRLGRPRSHQTLAADYQTASLANTPWH
jgi:hypothetical protein